MSKLLPIYNCERLYIFPMTDEENEVYGNPIILTKKLMTYDDSTSTNTTSLYGDGEIVDSAVDEGEGTLALGIHGLTDEEFSKIYGAEVRNGSVVETGEEVSPYCCVALMARKGKNTVVLRKWPKVRFAKHTESVQQKQGNTTYSTPTITGTFVKCERLNAKRVRRTIKDTTSSAAQSFITHWFDDPDFLGSTVVNQSYIMLAGENEGDTDTKIAENDGDEASIAGGRKIIVVCAAQNIFGGGTPTYKVETATNLNGRWQTAYSSDTTNIGTWPWTGNEAFRYIRVTATGNTGSTSEKYFTIKVTSQGAGEVDRRIYVQSMTEAEYQAQE